MDLLTTALSGLGISVIGLCALRTWRARGWASISRVAHLRDKMLDGKVRNSIFHLFFQLFENYF